MGPLQALVFLSLKWVYYQSCIYIKDKKKFVGGVKLTGEQPRQPAWGRLEKFVHVLQGPMCASQPTDKQYSVTYPEPSLTLSPSAAGRMDNLLCSIPSRLLPTTSDMAVCWDYEVRQQPSLLYLQLLSPVPGRWKMPDVRLFNQ